MKYLIFVLGAGLMGCHICDWSDSDSGAYRYESSGWWGSERVEALGDIQFAPDGSDVTAISPGGYLRIEKRSWLREQSYVIRAMEDGSLEKSLTIQRQKVEVDESTERWVRDMIDLIQRKTPIGAKARAERLYRDRGTQGVVDEIYQLESNQAKRVVLTRGVELALADSQSINALVTAAERSIESSSALAEFIVDVSRFGPNDSVLTEQLFEACGEIESNSKRSETILELARTRQMNGPAIVIVLTAIDRMSSSTKKSETLSGLLPDLMKYPERVDQTLRVIGNIESNTQQAAVLMDLLRQDLTPDMYVGVVRTVDRMHSNSQRASILSSLVRACPADESIFYEVSEAVDNMESSSAQEDVLMRLLDRRDLTKSVLLKIQQTTEHISSSSARSRIQQVITQRLADLVS